MESLQKKPPVSFYIIAVIALLWNIIGVISFYMHVFISEETLAALPEAERNLYGQYPLWTEIVFAVAVLGGLLGSIGLLMRKSWCRPVFIISLIAIVFQMFHNVFLTDAMDVYGAAQTVTMPLIIVLIAIYLVWYSKRCIRKGWLS